MSDVTPGTEGPLDLPTASDAQVLARSRGSMFLVTNRQGDIRPSGARELGLFHRDTRHLSHWHLVIGRGEVIFLGSDGGGDAYNQIDLMVSDVEDSEFLDDPKNFLHIRRRQILDGGLVEEITLTNHLPHEKTIALDLVYAVDFADLFEARGAKRPRRGTYEEARVEDGIVSFAYDGLCGTRYETSIAFDTPPAKLTTERASFSFTFAANETRSFIVAVASASGANARALASKSARDRIAALLDDSRQRRAACTTFGCDDDVLGSVLRRSVADVHALVVDVFDNRIIGAGIPWFCCPFGRDSLITAFQLLLYSPSFAIDALRTLGRFQGKRFVHETEEEPGKIFHELRFGEMAKAGETPHRPYYGSIDATPLYVVLAEALHRVIGDVAVLRELEPAVRAALGWIDARSDEGKKLVTYERSTPRGIENQCWKDSRAGVSAPDGWRAAPPVAVCEVQGYCIDAYARGARILRALSDEAGAATYAARAERLRETFEERFWLADEKRYAYAIDGQGRVVDTLVSNVGHLLWSRVVPPERAAAIAETLLGPASFSGYGIRTLAEGQKVYNPLSYHNGTVWPHDNAIIAHGFGLYDLKDAAIRVLEGLHDAMGQFHDHRLPELFAGISRGDGPLVRYPVACSPQAWAAGTPFMLLQAVLGIEPDAPNRRLVIRNPRLPSFLRSVELTNLRVGASSVNMCFRRAGTRCHVEALEVKGPHIQVLVELE